VIGWIVAAFAAAQLAGDPQGHTPLQAAGSATAEKVLTVDGHLSLSGNVLPVMDAAELRPQVMIDARGAMAGTLIRYRVQGIFEALVGVRAAAAGQVADRRARVMGAIARVRDAWIETAGRRADLRAGYGRVVWGRLDEIQPSDVINPLDASRFLLDGRSEARLPVAFVRGRFFAREDFTIEGVLAPVFERGRFDELKESTSPFNLLRDIDVAVLPASVLPPDCLIAPLPHCLMAGLPGVRRIEPDRTWSNVSGGARVSATIGRLDVAGAVYRGFESFGLVTLEAAAAPQLTAPVELTLVERYPRFTMVAGDFETVRGEWALRGEAAFFVEKPLLGATRTTAVDGRALDAGVGFDRRSGDYRMFGSVIVHREWSMAASESTAPPAPAISNTHLNLVASLERPFARDRYFVRGFGVVNPGDGAGFVRVLFVWTVRDDVTVEGSAAAFLGTSDDTLGRFQDRDFLLTRLRYRW
jgi:hypothetical protein